MEFRPYLRKEVLEVKYSKDHWKLLENHRKNVLKLMEALSSRNILSTVYGSIARGDVKIDSDIDVFTVTPTSSMEVELALEKFGIKPLRRILIQATPYYAPKGYFEIEKSVSISLPLVKLRKTEREFYEFAGEIEANDIKTNKRVTGVDKHLMLIEPRKQGHLETSIIGREAYASKLLGISMETVLERVRILMKRAKSGRTGRFIEMDLPNNENFESVLHRLANKNSVLRKRLKK